MDQVMKFLSVKRTSIQRYMNAGMPFHRINGRPVFYGSEINDWIRKKRKK